MLQNFTLVYSPSAIQQTRSWRIAAAECCSFNSGHFSYCGIESAHTCSATLSLLVALRSSMLGMLVLRTPSTYQLPLARGFLNVAVQQLASCRGLDGLPFSVHHLDKRTLLRLHATTFANYNKVDVLAWHLSVVLQFAVQGLQQHPPTRGAKTLQKRRAHVFIVSILTDEAGHGEASLPACLCVQTSERVR